MINCPWVSRMVAESKTDHGVPVELVEQNSVSFRNRPKFWIAIANLAFSNIFGAAPSCWNGDYLFGLNNSNFLKYVTSMGIEYGDLQDRELEKILPTRDDQQENERGDWSQKSQEYQLQHSPAVPVQTCT